MIRFTAVDMVVGETSSIDHLVSVYQGDANAVLDEGTVQKEAGISTLRGKMSKIEEDFLGFACYACQQALLDCSQTR
jgi:hypothetical protein